MRATTSDGIEVAVHDLGGDGPPVIFAHATGFHGMVWRPIAEVLGGSFRCWSFDERGHGDTPPAPDGNFEWHGFARDLLAVVDALALDEQPYAVGHSAGAAAIFLAEEERPGTFRAVYGYEPVVIPSDGAGPAPSPRANPLATGARKRRETFPSRDDAYANYAGKPPFNSLAPAALRAYVDHGFTDEPDGAVRLKCRGENEARTYEMSTTHGAYARFAEVKCPVTVACGADTDAFGPPMIAAQAERLPDARTHVFPGLGHFGPLQDPAGVATHIRAFFDKV
jgi:pimeloyl-ACP methyl ester carboxylesterase